jgi:hypothetical protein
MKSDLSPTTHNAVSGDPALVLLDQNRLAELLGCSARTLERQRLEGTGVPFCRVGRLVRYRLSELHLQDWRCLGQAKQIRAMLEFWHRLHSPVCLRAISSGHQGSAGPGSKECTQSRGGSGQGTQPQARRTLHRDRAAF